MVWADASTYRKRRDTGTRQADDSSPRDGELLREKAIYPTLPHHAMRTSCRTHTAIASRRRLGLRYSRKCGATKHIRPPLSSTTHTHLTSAPCVCISMHRVLPHISAARRTMPCARPAGHTLRLHHGGGSACAIAASVGPQNISGHLSPPPRTHTSPLPHAYAYRCIAYYLTSRPHVAPCHAHPLQATRCDCITEAARPALRAVASPVAIRFPVAIG